MIWDYKREEKKDFELIPEGVHRVRIKSADITVSRSGNNMLAMQFYVSGYNGLLYHYIAFLQDRPEVTNSMLSQLFDSFEDIAEGDTDTEHWIGKVGAVKVKHEEYNGKTRAKISYFVDSDDQDDLPPWKEPGSNAPTPGAILEDLPF